MTLLAAALLIVVLTPFTPFQAWADECPAGGEHDYDAELVQPATDDSAGFRRFVCQKCGDTFKQEIPATGHDWGPWVVDEEPTCEAEGIEYRECGQCGAREERHIPTISSTGSHTWQETSHVEATCENPGEIEYTCTICGEKHHDYIIALDHDWGSWEQVRPAGEGVEGLERRVCRHDSAHVEERAIPALMPEERPSASAPPSPAEPFSKPSTSVSVESKPANTAPRPASETVREPSTLPLPEAKPDPWAPNALDAVLLGFDALALVLFAVFAGPLIYAMRWAAAKRRDARQKPSNLEDNEGGRVL